MRELNTVVEIRYISPPNIKGLHSKRTIWIVTQVFHYDTGLRHPVKIFMHKARIV